MIGLRFLEQQRKHDAWKNSLEGILNDLTVLPGTASDDDRLLVAQVLYRLPKHIREKVLESKNGATFVLFNPDVLGETQELYFNQDHLGLRWFIFLSFPLRMRLSRKRKMTVIAHEIAHFVLKHASGGREAEKAADNLCQKWGFGRGYKNYDQFRLGPLQRKPKQLRK